MHFAVATSEEVQLANMLRVQGIYSPCICEDIRGRILLFLFTIHGICIQLGQANKTTSKTFKLFIPQSKIKDYVRNMQNPRCRQF